MMHAIHKVVHGAPASTVKASLRKNNKSAEVSLLSRVLGLGLNDEAVLVARAFTATASSVSRSWTLCLLKLTELEEPSDP